MPSLNDLAVEGMLNTNKHIIFWPVNIYHKDTRLNKVTSVNNDTAHSSPCEDRCLHGKKSNKPALNLFTKYKIQINNAFNLFLSSKEKKRSQQLWFSFHNNKTSFISCNKSIFMLIKLELRENMNKLGHPHSESMAT